LLETIFFEGVISTETTVRRWVQMISVVKLGLHKLLKQFTKKSGRLAVSKDVLLRKLEEKLKE